MQPALELRPRSQKKPNSSAKPAVNIVVAMKTERDEILGVVMTDLTAGLQMVDM